MAARQIAQRAINVLGVLAFGVAVMAWLFGRDVLAIGFAAVWVVTIVLRPARSAQAAEVVAGGGEADRSPHTPST